MFEILMLASIALIVLSQTLPEKPDDKENNALNFSCQLGDIAGKNKKGRLPTEGKIKKQPCRTNYGRAA